MARPLRIEYEGAYYHVISRGERREAIFRGEEDKAKYLDKLREAVERFGIKVHCYVLMDNHYHLLIETPRANIVKAMQYINTNYSNWYKAKRRIVGSVFQGRYKSILVDKDAYMQVLSAYIHLNPVRAGMVKQAERYGWSSYRYYLGRQKAPEWLWTKDVLGGFSGGGEVYRGTNPGTPY